MDFSEDKSLTIDQIIQSQHSNFFELIPQSQYCHILSMFRNNMNVVIDYVKNNKQVLFHMIDIGLNTFQFESDYVKELSNFCHDVFYSQNGVSQLFLVGKNEKETQMIAQNCQQIQEQINLDLKQFQEVYATLLYTFQYLRKPVHLINPICINYHCKLITHLIQTNPEEIYLFFSHQSFFCSNDQPTTLNLLIQQCYNFSGISQALGKIISEEGPINKYKNLKQQVVDGILSHLLSEEKLKANIQNYQNLLDFVSFCFMRNKYGRDEGGEQICEITQKFVKGNLISFYKQKLIKAALDVHEPHSFSQSYISNLSSSGRIAGSLSESANLSKTLSFSKQKSLINGRKYSEDKEENSNAENQLFQTSQTIFHNSLSFMIILIERLNAEEERDQYSFDNKPIEPTINFEVDEIIFSEDCLLELMTLSITSKFNNIERMRFYELLVLITKNSRFVKLNLKNSNFFLNILIHLLKSFKKQFNYRKNSFSKKKNQFVMKNSMVKFYIQQLITQVILPKIDSFDAKEAMLVLSAFNPSSDILNLHLSLEDKPHIFKIMLMLQDKCSWFQTHFENVSINLVQMKKQFASMICGESTALNDRSLVINQFEFMKNHFEERKINEKQKQQRKYSGEWSSSSNSDDIQKGSRRQFVFPNVKMNQKIVQWNQNQKQKVIDENQMQQIN